jgi:hypothetical protein
VTIDAAILDTIRRTLPGLWMPGDYFPCTEAALRHYAAKATACSSAQPRRVLEIGTRAGYSLAAMALVAPAVAGPPARSRVGTAKNSA